jgi:hypothetical protein
MESLSIWHWIVIIFWVGLVLPPGWRIASKAGFHGAWALLLLVPLVNLALVWAFAFARWPKDRAT